MGEVRRLSCALRDVSMERDGLRLEQAEDRKALEAYRHDSITDTMEMSKMSRHITELTQHLDTAKATNKRLRERNAVYAGELAALAASRSAAETSRLRSENHALKEQVQQLEAAAQALSSQLDALQDRERQYKERQALEQHMQALRSDRQKQAPPPKLASALTARLRPTPHPPAATVQRPPAAAASGPAMAQVCGRCAVNKIGRAHV